MNGSSQFAPLIFVPAGRGRGQELAPSEKYREGVLEDLVFQHPEILPVNEIDPAFENLFSVCQQMTVGSGAVDALFATPNGMLVVAEFKLWRNPEARREVVAQILDYAKDLARWSYSELQDAISGSGTFEQPGNLLYQLATKQRPDLDETTFVDAVSRNLQSGRFLLLVVGDGIREGVKAIVSFLREHAALDFTFGLIEASVYDLPDGAKLWQARTLARTEVLDRFALLSTTEPRQIDEKDRGRVDPGSVQWQNLKFWKKVLSETNIDDRRHRHIGSPSPTERSTVFFAPYQPVFEHIWITASLQRKGKHPMMKVVISRWRTSEFGVYALDRLKDQADGELHDALDEQLESWSEGQPRRPQLGFRKVAKGLARGEDSINKDDVGWMADHITRLVNAVAPRIKKWAETAEEIR